MIGKNFLLHTASLLGIILYAHQAHAHKTSAKKQWTVIIYIAADNDLRGFAARNIKQMAMIGSNNDVNICVELHIRISGNKKITRRYYIEQNKIVHVNEYDPHSQKLDSGDPNTLTSCCRWFVEQYPANHYALILWDHGTGIMDPTSGRIINSTDLFTFNPIINKLELNRSIGFLDLIHSLSPEQRGICWDDSTGNYLNNQKLAAALQEIYADVLGNKKIDILGFDACLMSMLEIADIAKHYAHIMIASQEVELGTGWDYRQALQPLSEGILDAKTFAQHIVQSYHKTYRKITNDYTLSAINLDHLNELENNVNVVAQLLTEGLKNQKNNSVKSAIKASREKHSCTHFDEPSYIDLHHFYSNLLTHLPVCKLNEQESTIKTKLSAALQEGCNLIKSSTLIETEFDQQKNCYQLQTTKHSNCLVLANTRGTNLHKAQGISIYFPENRIHSSYRKTNFAAHNEWLAFLTHYLLS